MTQTFWVQQFAGLVLMFGIGYFRASRDFEANANIIRLAVAAKFHAATAPSSPNISGNMPQQITPLRDNPQMHPRKFINYLYNQ